jgi:hypothetical protein
MKDERRRKSQCIAYFICQGVATLAWWGLIAASPVWRRRFAFGDDGASIAAFLPADIVFWCIGSLAAAWGEWRGSAWTATVRHVLCGAIGCSVAHAATLAYMASAGWPGVFLMLPAFGLTVWWTWRAST